MKTSTTLILMTATSALLIGCSGTKEKLGLTRKAPDEFAVLKRAPLEVPPDLRALPIPNRGAPRPQEDTAEVTAQKALFGEEVTETQPTQNSTDAEDALLSQARANEAEKNIRNIVDEETERYATEEQAVIDKLLKRKKTVPGSTLNAREEIERLKEEQIPTPNVPPSLVEK